jgi:hypothetical protein
MLLPCGQLGLTLDTGNQPLNDALHSIQVCNIHFICGSGQDFFGNVGHAAAKLHCCKQRVRQVHGWLAGFIFSSLAGGRNAMSQTQNEWLAVNALAVLSNGIVFGRDANFDERPRV